MQTQPIRTTIQIDPILYRQVKIKMAEGGLTFRHMVETSLKTTYGIDQKTKKTSHRPKKVKFGGYHLGGFKGSLSRSEFYDDIEKDLV